MRYSPSSVINGRGHCSGSLRIFTAATTTLQACPPQYVAGPDNLWLSLRKIPLDQICSVTRSRPGTYGSMTTRKFPFFELIALKQGNGGPAIAAEPHASNSDSTHKNRMV